MLTIELLLLDEVSVGPRSLQSAATAHDHRKCAGLRFTRGFDRAHTSLHANANRTLLAIARRVGLAGIFLILRFDRLSGTGEDVMKKYIDKDIGAKGLDPSVYAMGEAAYKHVSNLYHCVYGSSANAM